ncbi:hypothetical protein ABL78_1542 [Leptomonas seymouri]|uniref:Right handed beta helix domain-containing protein n=1 Tax=Leptomonas seymouri TaxID=5684 RepID=A0A0N1IMA0_LEPSE|nr:hypothetical protein ABL78_1542 [Leptomonas seymouri]|eukprot:KPI89313.1 hypothetical protein ABL78_1542 [Leptomonas seymouri]
MRRTGVVGVLCASSLTGSERRSAHGGVTTYRVGAGLVVPRSAWGGAASRGYRVPALRFENAAGMGLAHWTPARSLFGSWKAEKINSEGSASEADADAGAQANVHVEPGTAAAQKEIERLRQQIVDLQEALQASQETVKQLLMLNSAPKASGPSAAGAAARCRSSGSPSGPCGGAAEVTNDSRGASYVVRTSEELIDALRGRGSEHASRTILLDGELFVLDMYAPVEVDQARVSILGNNATVIGPIAVRGRGAVLAISDAFLFCPHGVQLRLTDSSSGTAVASAKTPARVAGTPLKESMMLTPVVSATAGAGVHLDRCVLSNGRDGVYLGMGSRCTLNHVRIVNCIRGLYEGVGCRTSMMDACTFQANRYHMVLLGPDKAEWAGRIFQSPSPCRERGATCSPTFSSNASVEDVLAPGVTATSVVALQQNKAQVVLQHNPITDIYEDCWVDGQRVELSGADATSGLSDPLF